MVGRAIVAAHLDISAVTLRTLVETKVIDDAEPGEMDIDTARVNYIRHLRAQQRSEMKEKPPLGTARAAYLFSRPSSVSALWARFRDTDTQKNDTRTTHAHRVMGRHFC